MIYDVIGFEFFEERITDDFSPRRRQCQRCRKFEI